jgi:hypothetical protein
MPVATREGVRITTEATPGVYNGAGTSATIALPSSNAFPNRPSPRPFTLRDVGSSNRRVQTGFGTVGVDLKLKTPLWYSQASVILPLFCTPTGTPLELPTFTVDHYQMLEDGAGTCVYERYLGCMGKSLAFGADNTPQGTVCMIDLEFPFLSYSKAITVSDFPEAALNAYPWPGSLALFQHLGGHVTLGGSARTGYKSFGVSYKNVVATIYDESTYPQANTWRGRDVDFKFNLRHKTDADRVKYLAMTSNTCAVTLTDGSTNLAFDFKAKNFIGSCVDDTALDNAHYQALDYMNYLDGSALTDATHTIS